MLRKLYKRSPWLRRRAHRIKDAGTYRLAAASVALASRYPLERALVAADHLGDAAFHTLHRTRSRAVANLDRVFGNDLSPADRQEIVRLSLRGFARSFCEIVKMNEIRPVLGTYATLNGWKEIEPLIDRGTVTCSAHLGNWEILASYMSQIEGREVAAVARRLDEPRLNQMLVDLRTSNGVESILRDSPSAGRQMLKVLKNPRGMLAMLIDQDTKVSSITVPFLGFPARTPVAPAALAVRRDLPVLVAYALRRPEGGLTLEMKGPLSADKSLERDAAVRDLTERINDVLSQAIRENPTQWPWWHQRWRRGPQPRLDPDAPID